MCPISLDAKSSPGLSFQGHSSLTHSKVESQDNPKDYFDQDNLSLAQDELNQIASDFNGHPKNFEWKEVKKKNKNPLDAPLNRANSNRNLP